MNFKILCASLMLTACVHEAAKLEVVADVRIGETYKLANEPKVAECTIVPSNVITVIGAGEDLVSTEALGTEGMVCGVIDCTSVGGRQLFTCSTFEMIKGQQALPKSAN